MKTPSILVILLAVAVPAATRSVTLRAAAAARGQTAKSSPEPSLGDVARKARQQKQARDKARVRLEADGSSSQEPEGFITYTSRGGGFAFLVPKDARILSETRFENSEAGEIASERTVEEGSVVPRYVILSRFTAPDDRSFDKMEGEAFRGWEIVADKREDSTINGSKARLVQIDGFPPGNLKFRAYGLATLLRAPKKTLAVIFVVPRKAAPDLEETSNIVLRSVRFVQ